MKTTVYGVKCQGQGHGPSGRRHIELDTVHQVLISNVRVRLQITLG